MKNNEKYDSNSYLNTAFEKVKKCLPQFNLVKKNNESSVQPNIQRKGKERTLYLIDNSSSMAESDYKPTRLEAAKNAVLKAVELKRHIQPDDCVAVVTYSDIVRQVIPFKGVHDLTIFQKAFATIAPDGTTNIKAGLDAAEAVFAKKSDNSMDRIILLSDGMHNALNVDPLAVSVRLKHQNILIDTIGIGSSPSVVNEVLLKNIASCYKGELRYRFITNAEELLGHFLKNACLVKYT